MGGPEHADALFGDQLPDMVEDIGSGLDVEADGRLEAPGRAAVEAAKANGMWTVMDSVEDLVVPDDLAAAFEQVGTRLEKVRAGA